MCNSRNCRAVVTHGSQLHQSVHYTPFIISVRTPRSSCDCTIKALFFNIDVALNASKHCAADPIQQNKAHLLSCAVHPTFFMS